jgi:CubicO group peptidase (beta-lactamase class C family)
MRRLPSALSPVLLLALSCIALTADPAFAQKAPAQPASPRTADLPVASPESVGFSSARLENLHALMQQVVDSKQIPGAVTILARHGKIVDYQAYGVMDLASGAPMTKDAIFRDFSMTKPVTGVAMMILFEEGKWLPSDPIAKYVPEFAHLKVYKGTAANGQMLLEDPNHPPTMAELMSHTAGFTYGFFGDTPVDRMYRDQKVMESASLDEFIGKLAKIPLVYQPGTAWRYSVSMDIEGYIVQKLSGESLPDFLREHVYEPLSMKDAGFYVPAEKRTRFVTVYHMDPSGQLVPNTGSLPSRGDYEVQPGMPSGGGGMVSTAADYYRFAQMLENGGELDGKRILAPATVKLMTSNHLAQALLTGEWGIGVQIMRPGLGYAYNGAVEFDPPMANLPGGAGTYYWDGAAGTWFWVDPANDIVFVGMVQRMLDASSPTIEFTSRSAVYGALVDPAK